MDTKPMVYVDALVAQDYAIGDGLPGRLRWVGAINAVAAPRKGSVRHRTTPYVMDAQDC